MWGASVCVRARVCAIYILQLTISELDESDKEEDEETMLCICV